MKKCSFGFLCCFLVWSCDSFPFSIFWFLFPFFHSENAFQFIRSPMSLINPNPVLRTASERPSPTPLTTPNSNTDIDPLDVYDFIRDIKDPEHPYTLEDLMVVKEELVEVTRDEERKIEVVHVTFVPTVPHCSLASLIALCIRQRLTEELPEGTKIIVEVAQGSHQNEDELNKQINDKERVHAALENPNLLPVIRECIKAASY